jgi:magnesium chelatase subunit D
MGVILAMASRGDFFPEETTTGDEQLPAPPAPPQSSLQPLPPPPDIDQREEEKDEQEEQQEESEDEELGETEKEKQEEEEMLDIPLQFLFGVDAVPVDPNLMYFNKWTRKGKEREANVPVFSTYYAVNISR